jgi:outer membrane protein assembly factor BamB
LNVLAVSALPAQAAPPTPAKVARSDGTRAHNFAQNLSPKSATSTAANWGTYHHDLARSGYDSQQPTFGSVVPGWATPATVDGAVYAEPLVVGSTVIVATENNSVYALGLSTGSVHWRTNLGPPVPNASLPCGNVDPVGITGTPVVDQVAGIVYVVGLVQPAGQAMAYQLAAINLANGNVAYQVPITVTGLDPQHHGQRAALTLSAGTLYIPFGGRWGDCTPYHGWLVAAPASTGGPFSSFQTSINSGGGLWQPGGASVDAAGNLYVASGNTFCTSPCAYDGGETVFKLSTSLQTLDYFAPTNWSFLNSQDLDVGSTNPLLLDAGLLFQVGKSGDGYLLKQANLGHIGGQAFTDHVCPGLFYDAAFGGDAYVFPYIYVPCRDRLVALKLDTTAPSFAFAWQGPSVSWSGPPIVAAGLVWTLDPAGTLFALNPSTGATAFSTNVGAAAHFATPASGGGAVFVAAGSKVFSFIAATSVATYSVANTPSTWASSQTQTYAVTVTNTGSLPWPAAGSNPVRLGVHFANTGGGYGNNTWYTDQRFSLPADLAPGASVVLTIAVTAPSAPSGSLVLEYQMVKELQFWFAQFSDLLILVS